MSKAESLPRSQKKATTFDVCQDMELINDPYVYRVPSIGDTVWYITSTNISLPAAIHGIHSDTAVELRVHDSNSVHGVFRVSPVEYDRDKQMGTWHYDSDRGSK